MSKEYPLDQNAIENMTTEQLEKAVDFLRNKALHERDVAVGSDRFNRILKQASSLELAILRKENDLE